MRIISYNVNGIRAAMKKGLVEWLETDPADVICFQEVKAHRENIDFKAFEDLGFHDYWFPAEKKGYSGVAIFSKQKADQVMLGSNMPQSDAEGRVIGIDLGDVTIINAYFPSGTSGDERQQYKYQWLDEFQQYLNELRTQRPNLILCGDYNIAHREIDIHDPKGNKKSSGFLPEERAWMDQFLATGFVDTFRHFHQDPHHYSWWSQRFPSVRLQNKGWRIDYISVTSPLLDRLESALILPDVKHSDHCPVFLSIR
jgi:exodeoxyribonuclease-3